MKCIEQAKGIYKYGVESAQRGSLLNYRDVLEFLGYKQGVTGHAIRFGLELAWIACAYSNLPIVTAIVVNKSTGMPTESGYSTNSVQEDINAVLNCRDWPDVDSIDWCYVWSNRIELSEIYGTRGYWRKT